MSSVSGTNVQLHINALPGRMLELEEAAFREFADYFGPLIRALFRKCGLPPMDAEDLAVSYISDIALRVHQYRQIDETSFAAWVYAIARNAAADWWTQTGNTREGIRQLMLTNRNGIEAAGDHENNDEPACSRPEVAVAVQEALFALTEQQREIVYLRDLGEERSYAEIGAMLRIPAGTARVRHKRALDHLRSTLAVDPRMQRIIAACFRPDASRSVQSGRKG